DYRVRRQPGEYERAVTRFNNVSPTLFRTWIVVSVAELMQSDPRTRLQQRAIEQRVSEIAQKLFDLTWPLHGLGCRERRLLRLAAFVHDVGRAIDDRTHPKQ